MGTSIAAEVLWPQLSVVIAERMGLHFPSERQVDLQRGLAGAANELGFEDAAVCAQWLLSAPLTKNQMQTLATHLTVGETYFFRDQKAFDVLAECVLPPLLEARRKGERRLRIWSAACCTGEEPYSLAILLDRLIPDLCEWQVTILATDINGRFLQKAAAGVYGEWSFRESPPWLKERYFNRTADGRYAIASEIKKRVTFAHLNLVEDVYPALTTDTDAMDMIFCRNALMYFTQAQARKTAGNLHRALVRDGWLVVSPSEGSQVLCSGFSPSNFSGVILYQKSNVKKEGVPVWTPPPRSESVEFFVPTLAQPISTALSVGRPTENEPPPYEKPPTPLAAASALYVSGHYAEAVETILSLFSESIAPSPPAFSLLARALANQGRLAEALTWCDRWVAADKLDSSSHYLRAVVLQELGDYEQTRCSLQRTLYLQPDFLLAHFALGILVRSRGQTAEAGKHFATVLRLLHGCQPGDLIPESDGLTAGRLTEITSSLVALEATR